MLPTNLDGNTPNPLHPHAADPHANQVPLNVEREYD